jgi:hypothetical protein
MYTFLWIVGKRWCLWRQNLMNGAQPSVRLHRLHSICSSQQGVCVDDWRKEFFILKTYGGRKILMCGGKQGKDSVHWDSLSVKIYENMSKAYLKFSKCQLWTMINVGWVLISMLWEFLHSCLNFLGCNMNAYLNPKWDSLLFLLFLNS